MAEFVIKRVTEKNEEIGGFINEGFSKYCSQNKLTLNYDEFCFVAETEDRIIGAITGRAYYNEVHIGDLIVEESYRKCGLGSKLVKIVEDTYKGKEYEIITLTTFGFQAPEFYKKLGYQIDFVRNNRDSRLSKYFLSKVL